MELPSIYTQPIADLENFEMSGDSLTVVKDCSSRINRQENDPSGTPAKKSSTRAATHIESNS